MTDLEKQILFYSNAYYQGNELISDKEYDALVNKLRKENPDSELLGKPIGSDLKGISKKYKIPITMGTLEKCNTDEQFKGWYYKHDTDNLICEIKLDGAGALLEYMDGELTFVYSRGNGEFGEDITDNASKVNGVIKKLKSNFTGYIKGEIILKNSTFKKYFSDMANPRNTAAGIIKRLDGEGCNFLNFVGYDVFDSNETVDKTEESKLNFLKFNDFEIPIAWTDVVLDDIIKLKNDIDKYIEETDYNIDGIVVKQNKTDKNDLMRHTPLNNVAFKPNLDIGITTVKRIRWQLQGRYFSPVVDVEPVELCGTKVTKASVANVNIMNDLGIYEGAEVEIVKNGEIIPGIQKVFNPKKNSFMIPTVCPVCGKEVKVNNSGIPECINEECPRKTAHRFKKMFEVLGIKGAGPAFINKMEELNLSVEDFLNLCSENREDILCKFAGGINGKKVLIQMQNAMTTPITIAKFLATFDYRGFDEKKLKLLDFSLEEMYNLSISEIKKIDGFADITANNFIEFMRTYKNEIDRLSKYFILSSNEEKKTEGKLSGKSFCFTGKAVMPRKQLQDLVNQNGGNNKDSVTSDLDYLVTDDTDSGSSKNVKAKKLGIPVISSTDFLNMLN